MGIKSLNQLLKKICGVSHMSHVPIDNFEGKKIAVDAVLYICAFKTRGSANYESSIIEFLTLLREKKIHPFFVFDGNAPIEKIDERSNRAEKRIAQRTRINMLKHDLEVYEKTNVLSDFIKSLNFGTNRLVPTKISIRSIRDYINKLESQLISITPEDFDTMKTILDIYGVKHVIADGEGEFLCAALNRHGIVDAVMTADTDAFPCLAPVVINKIIDSTYFQVVNLKDMLSKLNLTEKQFVDLCIMCGTDFNKNIPKIGPMGSYELILRHKSIDNLPSDIDPTILNHHRVRELFAYTDIKPDIAVPWCSKVEFDKLAAYVTDVDIIKNRIYKQIIKKRADKKYTFFWKPHEMHGFLSQWYPSKFTLDDIVYTSAEQYMMYKKAMLFKDTNVAKAILNTAIPNQHKQLGRTVSNFSEIKWNSECKNIVKTGNMAKFLQNENLLTKLLNTTGQLVEASPYDCKWGIGLLATDAYATDETKWRGANLLGNVLTEIRDELSSVKTA